MRRLVPMVTLVVLIALAGCSPSAPAGGGAAQGQAPNPNRAPVAPKLLVAAINEDPKNFWDGINGGGGSGSRQIGHMVNQYLAAIASDGTAQPRLLAAFPSIPGGSWVIHPDGKMDVTYTIRPGVTWHDGVPFTADDLVFSHEVGRDAAIPNGNAAVMRLIERVMALDDRTAVATYSQTYAFADRLEHREISPLPKHLLDRPFRENKETFIAQPYFSTEYVGTGPFKLVRWEPGSFMELTANDTYFLGRPKIDRVRIQFINDTNTGVANLRAGSVNIFLPTGSPDWDLLEPLKREWQGTGRGDVVLERVRWQFVEPQKGPIAQPADLRDLRVRQALLLAMNREELARALLGEQGEVAHSWVHPTAAYFPRVQDAITRYPYDPRRATALLAEAGWTPGPDGILQKAGQRFVMQIRPGEAREKESTILQQDWKAVGIDAPLEVLSNVLLRDAEARANYTGVSPTQNPVGGLSAVRRFATEQIPAAANRFAGTNRGQFSNAEWDEIGGRLRVALDDDSRLRLERELLTVLTRELPALPMQYELQAVAVYGFKGLVPITGVPHTGNIMHTWNVHEWDM